MQAVATQAAELAALSRSTQPAAAAASAYAGYQIIRRNGAVVVFEPNKIAVALMKAFLAVHGTQGAASASVRETVDTLTEAVVRALLRSRPGGGTFHIEDIQDSVELGLMRGGHHEVARAYVLYRERRTQERARQGVAPVARAAEIHVVDNGQRMPLDMAAMQALVESACTGLGADVKAEPILAETRRNLYDGVPIDEVYKASILAARTLIEKDPAYSRATARLLLHTIRREILGGEVTQAQMGERYAEYFPQFIKKGVQAELLDEKLMQYDLARLGAALLPERDLQFDYLGLQTLYDRYFLHIDEQRIEMPQAFFMRVAMGLALNEIDREARAIEFYGVLSSFDFMSSTPTLFNAGTRRSQLSSCYLTTVADDLDGIYEALKENALLSKFAGGLGNDWTNVRALGSYIKGTNGKSQGVVPFLKVVNDTAVAVNQCFAPDTGVYTADGVKPIRELKAGDLVLGKSGKYREVQRRFAYNQDGPMVSVKVKHSIDPMLVTSGHPFYAIRNVPMEQANQRTLEWLAKGKVRAEWVEAAQLQAGDYVAQVIPTEVVHQPGLTQDDARLYGILLGDGHLSKDGMQWGVSGNPARTNISTSCAATSTGRAFTTGRPAAARAMRRCTGPSAEAWCAMARQGASRVQGRRRCLLPSMTSTTPKAASASRAASRTCLERTRSSMVRGLLETDGGVSRGKEIYFTNTSKPLVEGLRYQLLRLGVPTAGQYREREQAHDALRSDGSTTRFEGLTKAFDLRIPAVPEVAALVGCKSIVKKNWLELEGKVFSRVKKVEAITPKPFVYDLKVDTDESYMTTSGLAHNGGKRKGAVCAYLETWHLDIEEFLELRKNTGDDRRRTHDMNTANWVPDLFMRRVMEGGDWTLFSPSTCPDLHDKFGKAFEEAYVAYEAKVDRGEIKLYKRMPAKDLWRKMLSMLFETGHPWITFKDACNVRSARSSTSAWCTARTCAPRSR